MLFRSIYKLIVLYNIVNDSIKVVNYLFFVHRLCCMQSFVDNPRCNNDEQLLQYFPLCDLLLILEFKYLLNFSFEFSNGVIVFMVLLYDVCLNSLFLILTLAFCLYFPILSFDFKCLFSFLILAEITLV